MEIIDKLGVNRESCNNCSTRESSCGCNCRFFCIHNEIEQFRDTAVNSFKSKANAQLIATAPEILEALIDLMTCDALKHMSTTIDNSKYSRLVEKATNKSWEEIKELING